MVRSRLAEGRGVESEIDFQRAIFDNDEKMANHLKDARFLEERLGYVFTDQALLSHALTHPSYGFEHPEAGGDNQRLEFLGDAVIDLLTAEYAYLRVPDVDEGVLTVIRSQCVSGKALAEIASRIDLGSFMRFGKSIRTESQRNLPRNLAACFEAVVGAIWLDGGLDGVRHIFDTFFTAMVDAQAHSVWTGNPKGRLQAVAQKHHVLPAYTVEEVTGPAHAPHYRVRVSALGHEAIGEGGGRHLAEAAAAAEWLENWRAEGEQGDGR